MEWNFGNIFLTMMAFFFWMTFIWMFVTAFTDIFRRVDLSGWAKAGWILLICALPLLGCLIYMVARPPTPMTEYADSPAGRTAADEITTLARLQDEGRISPAEFEELKIRAMPH